MKVFVFFSVLACLCSCAGDSSQRHDRAREILTKVRQSELVQTLVRERLGDAVGDALDNLPASSKGVILLNADQFSDADRVRFQGLADRWWDADRTEERLLFVRTSCEPIRKASDWARPRLRNLVSKLPDWAQVKIRGDVVPLCVVRHDLPGSQGGLALRHLRAIVLDPDWNDTIVLHEIGHLLGINHVWTPTVMNEQVHRPVHVIELNETFRAMGCISENELAQRKNGGEPRAFKPECSPVTGNEFSVQPNDQSSLPAN